MSIQNPAGPQGARFDSYAFSTLGYSQVFGQKPTRRRLELEFTHLSLVATVRLASALGAMFFNGADNRAGNQSALVRELSGGGTFGARAARFLNSGEWVLFHEELFSGMCKLALQHSPQDLPISPDFNFRFFQCALMFNELLSIESLPAEPVGNVEDILGVELRSLARNRDHPFAIVGRYQRFLAWLREPSQHDGRWTRSIDDDFAAAFGLSLDEYLALAAFFGTRLQAITSVERLTQFDAVINVPIWLQHLDDKALIERFLATFAYTLDEIRGLWQPAEPASLSLAGLGPLWKKPLVRLNDNHVVAPMPALIYNAVGEGLFYRILDQYDKPKKDEFQRAFGYFFEDYIRELFDAAYADDATVMVAGDDVYGRRGGGKTSDVVIFEGDDVIFVEVVARRVNLEHIIRDFDREHFERFIEHGVKKKLRQLHRNVEKYRARTIYPERPRPDGQRIFALIVTAVPFPHIYLLTKVIPDVCASEHYLDSVASIEIADVEEVEMLEESIRDGLRLAPFLTMKKIQQEHQSIKNVLLQIPEGRHGRPAILRGNASIETYAQRLLR